MKIRNKLSSKRIYDYVRLKASSSSYGIMVYKILKKPLQHTGTDSVKLIKEGVNVKKEK